MCQSLEHYITLKKGGSFICPDTKGFPRCFLSVKKYKVQNSVFRMLGPKKDICGYVCGCSNYGKIHKKRTTEVTHGEESLVTGDEGGALSLCTLLYFVGSISIICLMNKIYVNT